MLLASYLTAKALTNSALQIWISIHKNKIQKRAIGYAKLNAILSSLTASVISSEGEIKSRFRPNLQEMAEIISELCQTS